MRSLEAELGRCFQKTAWPLEYAECLLCTQLYLRVRPGRQHSGGGRDRAGPATGQTATVLQWQAQHEASQHCPRFSPKSLETRALETILPESRGQGYGKHPTSKRKQ